MKQSQNIRAFVTMATLIAGSAIGFAHDGIEHVMGTVKTLTGSTLTVETVKHQIDAIALDPATTYTNKGRKASLKDLKAGDRVVVDTKDDAKDKPHALAVKWGAMPGASDQRTTDRKPGDSKGDSRMDPKMKM